MTRSSFIRMAFIMVFVFLFVQKPNAQLFADSFSDSLYYIAAKKTNLALTVGAMLPEISALKIVQYPATLIKLSDLKGKIIILDFWNQRCNGCIAQFPKLNKLQKRFGETLKIIPVTFESRISVTRFLAKRKLLGNKIELPIIVEDTTLRQFFPHDGDPYEVWIDQAGKIKGITESYAITEKNIEGMLNGEAVNLPQRSPSRFYIDPHLPILVNNYGAKDNYFLYRSILTKYIDSLGIQFLDFSDSSMTRIFRSNQTMKELYKFAYGSLYSTKFNLSGNELPDKRVIIDSPDQEKFKGLDEIHSNFYDNTELYNFIKKNLYCYELDLPPIYKKYEAYKIMIQDLDRIFQVDSSIQQKKVKYLVIVRTISKEKFSSSKKQVTAVEDGTQVTYRDIKYFVTYLNSLKNLPIIVNESNYTGNIRITIPPSKSISLVSLRHILKMYNLDLVERYSKIDLLVLKNR